MRTHIGWMHIAMTDTAMRERLAEIKDPSGLWSALDVLDGLVGIILVYEGETEQYIEHRASVAGVPGRRSDPPDLVWLKSQGETPAHLRFSTSERGLKYMPTIYGEGVSLVRVYESSLAEEPRIWVYVEDRAGERIAQAHMSLDEARQLAEQLVVLVENHYQIRAGF